jgi:hypothetical protein
MKEKNQIAVTNALAVQITNPALEPLQKIRLTPAASAERLDQFSDLKVE